MKLYYSSLLPGLEPQMGSIQGLLEMGHWYSEFGMRLVVPEEGAPDSPFSMLSQLEEEGFLRLELEADPHDRERRVLQSVTLTTTGHRMLDELRRKSWPGRVRTGLGDLLWTVVVSAITALATMYIAG